MEIGDPKTARIGCWPREVLYGAQQFAVAICQNLYVDTPCASGDAKESERQAALVFVRSFLPSLISQEPHGTGQLF